MDITNHIPLVYRIVKLVGDVMPSIEYQNDRDDMVQDGMMGLLHAYQRYSPERGCAFATYAWPCIHGYIAVGIRRRRRHRHHTLSVSTISREVRRDDRMKNVDDRDECRAIMSDLTPRLRKIVRMRWLRDMSHPEIGRKIGVTRERATQLCSQAMSVMRANNGACTPTQHESGSDSSDETPLELSPA